MAPSLATKLESVPDFSLEERADENSFVGGVLVHRSVIQDRAFASVADADCYEAGNRFIYGTARVMRAAGVPVDPITVSGFVQRNALLEGDAPRLALRTRLAELAACAPDPQAVAWLGGMLVERSARRRLTEMGSRLRQLAADGSLADLRQVLRTEATATTAAIVRAERVIG